LLVLVRMGNEGICRVEGSIGSVLSLLGKCFVRHEYFQLVEFTFSHKLQVCLITFSLM
jgi:hypothetical protein